MIPGFGVDQLHVDAHAVSAALRCLEDIADIQLAPDYLHIVRLTLKVNAVLRATT